MFPDETEQNDPSEPSQAQGLISERLQQLQASAVAQLQTEQAAVEYRRGSQWTTVSPSNFATYYGGGMIGRPSQALDMGSLIWGSAPASQLTQRRNKEKNAVEQFLTTGNAMRSDNIKVFLSSNGKIVVRGYTIGDTDILFTIAGNRITAQKKRTKHIKTLLEEFAQTHNMSLSLIRLRPNGGNGESRISFWTPEGDGDLDDSALFIAAKPRQTISRQYQPLPWEEDDEDEDDY